MTERDFESLVAELVDPHSLTAKSRRLEGFLAERVRSVLRGEKEAEGTSEEIWTSVVRQEAGKRQSVSAA
ncbi:MAG: hypothetical protein AAFU85_05675 [Planctomycetota bacterium]